MNSDDHLSAGPEQTRPGSVRIRGRESEIRMLTRRLDAVARGRGGVVLIRGEAGIGKTSLLSAAESMARARRARVFHGRADVAAQAVPLAPLLDALVGTAEPPVDVDVLRSLAGSEDQRFWVLRELEEGLERAALTDPLVIGIDDIQWADAATLKAITTLPRRLAYHRILWLFSVRTGEVSEPARAAVAQVREADADILTLDRLDTAAVADVARDVLSGNPDLSLRRVIDGVGGHPFLLVELLRGLRDEALIDVETDTGIVRLTASRVPRRLLDSVEHQLARLSGTTRDVLQMASLLGSRFGVDELASLTDRPASSLLGVVHEAIHAGLVVQDGDRLGFRHDLVREAIDAALPLPLKRSLQHRAMYVMLEHGAPPADVAQLAMEVARPGDVDAIKLLQRAAGEIGQLSPSVAAPLSSRALALTQRDDPAYGTRIVETVDLLVKAGQASEATRLIAQITAEPVDPLTEAHARLNVVPLMMQYAAAESVDQCRRALALHGLPAALRIQMFSFMSSSLELLGEAEAAAETERRGDAELATVTDRRNEFVMLLPRALVAFAEGRFTEAVELADLAATGQYRSHGHAAQLWLFDAWKAKILLALGRLGDAAPIIEVGARRAQEEGIAANARIWSMLRARALLAGGDLAGARAEAEAVLDMSDEIGTGARGYINHMAIYVLHCVTMHTGDEAGMRFAQEAARKLLSYNQCRASIQLGAWMTACLASVKADDPNPPNLDPMILDPLACGPIRASNPRQHSDAARLVQMLRANGQKTDALRVADRLARAAVDSPSFPFIKAAAAHAGAVAREDWALAFEAVELYRDCPQPLVRALALEDAGRLLPLPRSDDAVAHLDAALDIYLTAGAHRDGARVRGLLRARGARRAVTSARSSTGWPELSESELSVVLLVARGATNREVGKQLFLSPHTVNAHLRHVFAKLGIRSRVELARLAAERFAAQQPSARTA